MVQRTPRAHLALLTLSLCAIPTYAFFPARQVEAPAAEQSLDELEQIFLRGSRKQKPEALAAIGAGDDQLERRIGLLAGAIGSNDQSLQAIARLSLERIGDSAKPTVRNLLDSADQTDLVRACGIISSLGSKADEFAGEVIEILKAGDSAQRHTALFALQNLSPTAIADSVALVIKELDSDNFNTQCLACAVLRQAGPAAKPAAARLVKLLNEGNVSTRSRAAQALAAIAPVDGVDIPELIAELLVAPTHAEKTRALEALGDLGLAAVNQLDRIEVLMDDASKNCRCEAALAYYRVSGKPAKSVHVLLEEVAARTHRIDAIECLGGMQDGAAQAVPSLTPYLDDEDPVTAETTVLALKHIGPAAHAALPKLEKLAAAKDFFLSTAAQEAIDAISRTPEKSSSL